MLSSSVIRYYFSRRQKALPVVHNNSRRLEDPRLVGWVRQSQQFGRGLAGKPGNPSQGLRLRFRSLNRRRTQTALGFIEIVSFG